MQRIVGVALVLSMLMSGLEAQAAKRVDLVLREGTNLAVALSPDGQWLALDALGRIWVMPVSGGTARALTDELGDARQPAWSPDGNTIAFQSYRDGGWHIWSVRADGKGLEQLTSGPFDEREPHFSPDGRRIAFSSDRSGNYDIWELDLAGGRFTQKTTHPANEFAPVYSAEGAIAYVSNRAPGGGVYVHADGTERALAQPTGDVSGVAWAPDQRQVSYVVTGAGATRLFLGTRELSSNEDVFPFRAQWLSSNELIYTADGRIKRRRLDQASVSEIPFATPVSFERKPYTRKATNFTNVAPQPAKGIVAPAIDPAGERIAFIALGDLWLMPIGGAPRRLTNDGFVETDPAWSPNGQRIVFSSDRGGTMDLWIRDLTTDKDEQLTTVPAAELAASWSPDGKQVAFLTHDGNLRIVDVTTREIRPGRRGQPAPLFSPGRPSWSADGQYIAVSVLRQHSSRFREGTSQILVISLADGTERVVVPAPHRSAGKRESDGPVWSPDGGKFALVIDGALQVVSVTPTGEPTAAPRRLNDDAADQLSWTGDSQRILYSAGDELRLVSIIDASTQRISVPLTWTRAAPPAGVVVHAVSLFDGKSPTLRRDVDIVIAGSRIRQIVPHSPALHRGTVVSAINGTVMPGLIETHTHLSSEYGSKLGRVWLSYGITAVREPAGSPHRGVERREAVESGRYPGPRIFTTGYTFDGMRIYYAGSMSIDNRPQIERELDRARTLGFDLAKTYVRLPDALQKQVVEGAHARGMWVTSHELYPAVALGVDGVEHIRGTSRRGYSTKVSALNRSYSDVIELLAASGMTLTPTTGIQGTFAMLASRDSTLLADARFAALFPTWIVERARSAVRNPNPDAEARLRGLGETVRRVVQKGGRVIAGTDAPIIPMGMSLHAEIEYYVLGGLSPFQALQTATIRAAEALGVDKDLGSIEVGKLADLVIVEGNPLENIRAARNVHTVMRGGVVYTLEQLMRGNR